MVRVAGGCWRPWLGRSWFLRVRCVVFVVQSGMVGRGVGKGLSGLGGGRGSGWKLIGNGSISVSMGVLFIVFTLGCGWGYGELYKFFFAEDG